ncbi:tachykinin-like peptides receptor 99D [Leguminivora glycinivorella]|uniref:tachykinin-like peptides receptor 99D n=1 Tax=Leguminivora glycinivorella TaxID=1035111 RepID=UPI00200BD2EB|nr:tachykinin-like peptides receptor 99D [Leguminivora glycinivorella]
MAYLTYNILFMLFTYLLPLLFMAYCYYGICILLWNTKVIGERYNDAQSKCKIQERKRMIKMLIFVVSTFAIGWLPFNVYFLLEGLWPSIQLYEHSLTIYLCFYWLAMLNSTLNPLIYYWFLPNFRRSFNQIFRWIIWLPARLCCCRRHQIVINTPDRYDTSRLATSRNNGLSNVTTMDTFVSFCKKPSSDVLAEIVDDAQQNCETKA